MIQAGCEAILPGAASLLGQCPEVSQMVGGGGEAVLPSLHPLCRAGLWSSPSLQVGSAWVPLHPQWCWDGAGRGCWEHSCAPALPPPRLLLAPLPGKGWGAGSVGPSVWGRRSPCAAPAQLGSISTSLHPSPAPALGCDPSCSAIPGASPPAKGRKGQHLVPRAQGLSRGSAGSDRQVIFHVHPMACGYN